MERIYFLCPGEFSFSFWVWICPQHFSSRSELSLRVPLCEAAGVTSSGPPSPYGHGQLHSCGKLTFTAFPSCIVGLSNGGKICLPKLAVSSITPHSIQISLPIPWLFLSFLHFVFVHQLPLSITYFYLLIYSLSRLHGQRGAQHRA